MFVSGMPDHANEDDIKNHFGSIGMIKMDRKTQKPKIWMYRDKNSGRSKGECTVTFEDPFTAKSAIQWFDGKDFMGSSIKVSIAERPKSEFERSGRGFGGGGRGRGGGGRFGRDDDGGFGGRGGGRGGGGGFAGRAGDWKCENNSCGNNNFAWRNNCNRCNEPKPDGAGGGGDDRGGYGGRGGGGGYRGGRGGYDRGGDRDGGPMRGGDRGPRSRPY